MKKAKVNGRACYVKQAGIEAYGNSTIFEDHSRYGSITFDDGEVITSVSVDTALVSHVENGAEGTFVFAKAGNQWLLLATEIDGKLRVAAGKKWGLGVVLAICFSIPMTLIGLLILLSPGFFISAFFLIPAFLAVRGAVALAGANSTISLIKIHGLNIAPEGASATPQLTAA